MPPKNVRREQIGQLSGFMFESPCKQASILSRRERADRQVVVETPVRTKSFSPQLFVMLQHGSPFK
jgi:hypothetical protein